MEEVRWTDVIPAVTTPFEERGGVDLAAFRKHVQWLVEHGASGVIIASALGEGITLNFAERLDLLRTADEAAEGRASVIATVSDTSTRRAVRIAREAEGIGCRALVVEPYLGYSGPWREVRAHLGKILDATSLPCMIENRPHHSGIDLLPEQIAELASEHGALVAVQESSGDVRRITALRGLVGDRLRILVGFDDTAFEGFRAGAVGWVSALANVLPREAVEFFRLASSGDPSAEQVYDWLLPILRIAGRVDAVQVLKLLQHEIGHGCARVRPPRLHLPQSEAARLTLTLRRVLAESPLRVEYES